MLLAHGPDNAADGFRRLFAHLLVGRFRSLEHFPGIPLGVLQARLFEHIGHLGGRIGKILRILDGHRRNLGGGKELLDGLLELFHALLPGGHDAQNRAAERLLERLQVDFDLVILRDVEHVHDDQHRNAHLKELRREVQVALEVGRVNDVDHALGVVGENVVAGHALVFARSAARSEGIDARQIDDIDLLISKHVAADFLFDGHARPVAHFLTGSCECIKKRRLSAIGIADDANGLLLHCVLL